MLRVTRTEGEKNHGGWDGGGGWWRETLKPQKKIDDRKQGKEKSIGRASELLRISGIHVLHGQKTHQRWASFSWRACLLQLVKGRISFLLKHLRQDPGFKHTAELLLISNWKDP